MTASRRRTFDGEHVIYKGVGAGAPPPTFLIDALTLSQGVVAAAYSTRHLRSAYAGSAIRVRRSSDNTEQDIGFVSEDLDTASLAAFVGAGNGFLTKWYDQSGNANDMVQATAGSQPGIRSSGTTYTRNGKACPTFGSSFLQNALMVAGSSFGGSAYEGIGVVAAHGAGPFSEYLGAATGLGAGALFAGANATTNFYAGDFDTLLVDNVATYACAFSDTLQTVDNYRPSGSSVGQPTVGNYENNSGRSWSGYIGEIVWFTSNTLTSGDRTTAHTNQKTYWGTA